jgi:hypothetical protein
MARSNESYRLNYGASDYNPDSSSGSVSIGRVGTPVRDLSSPDRSFGTGVGVRFGSSFGREGGGGGSSSTSDKFVAKTAVKKNAKGGSVKKMAKGGSASKARPREGLSDAICER